MVFRIKNIQFHRVYQGDFMNLKKYGIALLLFLGLFLFSNLLGTILGYFRLFSDAVADTITTVLVFISFFISGFYLGKKAEKKGWLEGLKIGLVVCFLFLLLRFLVYRQGMHLSSLLYYFLFLLTPIFGSMAGISQKKE